MHSKSDKINLLRNVLRILCGIIVVPLIACACLVLAAIVISIAAIVSIASLSMYCIVVLPFGLILGCADFALSNSTRVFKESISLFKKFVDPMRMWRDLVDEIRHIRYASSSKEH